MDEEKELITPETGLTAQQVQEHLEAAWGRGFRRIPAAARKKSFCGTA